MLLDPLKRDTFAGSGLVLRDPILDTLRRERVVGAGLVLRDPILDTPRRERAVGAGRLLTALRASGFWRLVSRWAGCKEALGSLSLSVLDGEREATAPELGSQDFVMSCGYFPPLLLPLGEARCVGSAWPGDARRILLDSPLGEFKSLHEDIAGLVWSKSFVRACATAPLPLAGGGNRNGGRTKG